MQQWQHIGHLWASVQPRNCAAQRAEQALALAPGGVLDGRGPLAPGLGRPGARRQQGHRLGHELGIDLTAEKNKRSAADEALAAGDLEGAVWAQLKLVYDPEIPVNIVDLGLVYSLKVEPLDNSPDRHSVVVAMTLTAPGCGMGPVIAEDARNRVLGVPGINQARVDIVWDPPWTQTMISEDGKMQLGLI